MSDHDTTPEAPDESGDAATAETPGATPGPPPVARRPATAWRRVRRALKPRATRAQILAAVLCAVLGFALVVQLRQTQEDEFAGLRQSDLVRILDDVNRRSDALTREAAALRETEYELRSGTDSQRAAIELAEQNVVVQGILSGRLPAEGPGLTITVVEGDKRITAARLFNVLEELRNAGAEAIEVNGIRMVTSSYFTDSSDGVIIDGVPVQAPYRWKVIGDPQTLEPAIAIPGGAVANIARNDGRATTEQKELVEITAVREPAEPKFATPDPGE